MANTPESISHIQIGQDVHPIDASTIGGETITNIENTFQLIENLVTEIDSNSTDTEYPSAKLLYDMIWGDEGEHQDEPLFDYSQEYLKFDVVEGGTILWKVFGDNSYGKTISYSLNDGNWTSITSTTSGVSINVNSGDSIKFKGNNSTYCVSGRTYFYNYFSGTATFNASGNIMSLVGGDDFSELNTLTSNYEFYSLFYQSKVISCKNLILPATTLTDSCYKYMFYKCTSLTESPELPATTLVNNCYAYMFQDCTSLHYIKVLATSSTFSSCTNWVSGVSTTDGTFVCSSQYFWRPDSSGRPSGWTVEYV